MGSEEPCRQISLACGGSACIVWATLGLPPLTVCVFSQSTLLRLQVALQGNCLNQALGWMHFLGLSHSGSGSQVLHKGTDSVLCPTHVQAAQATRCLASALFPGGVVHLIISLVPAAWIPSCAAGAPSQVCSVSPLGSWSLALTQLVDVNCPGSQEDLVTNWEAACSLIVDAVSGAEFLPWLSVLAIAPLHPWLWRGIGQSTGG